MESDSSFFWWFRNVVWFPQELEVKRSSWEVWGSLLFGLLLRGRLIVFGAAGVGTALVLPSILVYQFRSFSKKKRAVQAVVGHGEIFHVVVLYVYQGADRDPEN